MYLCRVQNAVNTAAVGEMEITTQMWNELSSLVGKISREITSRDQDVNYKLRETTFINF